MREGNYEGGELTASWRLSHPSSMQLTRGNLLAASGVHGQVRERVQLFMCGILEHVDSSWSIGAGSAGNKCVD